VSFEAQTCVVTGASSGVGRALSAALAHAGSRVWAIGRSDERLRALEEECSQSQGAVVPLTVDLERDADLQAATREILSDNGDVDVLVHCAGAIALGPFESISPEDLDRQLRVNLRAPVLLTQALLPALKRTRGQIVFVNSLAAHGASANNAIYAASKRGLSAIADSLREEVNAEGVRVSSIYIGRSATPMQVWMHEYEGRPYRPELLLQTDDVATAILGALAVPRSGEVTDMNLRPAVKLPPA